MTQTQARAVFVVPPEVGSGFRLAGVTVRTVRTTEEAAATVTSLLASERGVVGVDELFHNDFTPALRRRLARSVAPVVIAVPAGLATDASGARRQRILGMLQRAVGYHVTFGEEEP